MKLGRVIGTAIASNKVGNLEGKKLLVVKYLNKDLEDSLFSAVCIDTVNAGEGEIVLLCSSSSARFTKHTKGIATDNTIVGIVDAISSENKNLYKK